MKKYITLKIILLSFSLPSVGQLHFDSIISVLFHPNFDTIIVFKKIKFSEKPEKYTYIKVYQDNSISEEPVTKDTYVIFSEKSIKTLVDSFIHLGYGVGKNLSSEVKWFRYITRLRETEKSDWGTVYKFDIVDNRILAGDTI